MLRLRVKSSFRAERTAVMSAFTSSRSMMSPTRAELMLTLAPWPLALADGTKPGKENETQTKTGPQFWEQRQRKASCPRLTFSLLGGVELDAGCGAAGGAGEGGGLLEPGSGGQGASDLSPQQGAQQVQPTESHRCPEGAKTRFYCPRQQKQIIRDALSAPFI